MGVEELDKPAGEWCEHCSIGAGCRIYKDRPKMCRVWSCQWRARPDLYPEEMRPDRCGFLLTTTRIDNDLVVTVMVEYGNPGDEQTWPPLLRSFLDQLTERAGGAPLLVDFADGGEFFYERDQGAHAASLARAAELLEAFENSQVEDVKAA
jgi:hypothetical protein